MISKANIQLVKGLQDKKQRQKYDHFVVEGEKSITELLKSKLIVVKLFALLPWINENNALIAGLEVIEVDIKEMKQISLHLSPPNVLAIVNIPKPRAIDSSQDYILALDEIQDPGNLGTIIRTADWYGIKQIICSKGCTDAFSPKCINSTMGSFLRVEVIYMDILLAAKEFEYPIIVTSLEGQNIHLGKLPQRGLIVIGNEGHGIHQEIIDASQYQMNIPRFGAAESLNAAVSAAIVLDNFKNQANRD